MSYIVFEIPGNMMCKWIGPGWFIPAISLAFGICSLGTAFVNDLPSACGVRFVLGIAESPMLPGIAYVCFSPPEGLDLCADPASI